MKTYPTRAEAVAEEVTDRLQDWLHVADVDAIADKVIEETENGWRAREMEDRDFWKIFQKHSTVKTKLLTFRVVKQFPNDGMMIAGYGKETYMLPYDPELKPGDGVDVIAELRDK